MNPVEVIALSGCSRPENGRPCSICVGRAEKHVQAVETAGMVVVSAEDLRVAVADATAWDVEYRSDLGRPSEHERFARLRAALPERTH